QAVVRSLDLPTSRKRGWRGPVGCTVRTEMSVRCQGTPADVDRFGGHGCFDPVGHARRGVRPRWGRGGDGWIGRVGPRGSVFEIVLPASGPGPAIRRADDGPRVGEPSGSSNIDATSTLVRAESSGPL